MGSIRLSVGAEWLLDGRAFRIVRQPAANQYIAHDLKFNLEKTFTEEDLLALYAEGRLRFASGAPPALAAIPTAPRALPDLSPPEQEAIQRRWHAIEPLTQLGRAPRADDYRQRAAELERLGAPSSARSLRRYWKAWLAAGMDRMALAPGTARRGGRGRPRRSSMLQRYPVLRQLVDDAIQSVYLTTARRPIAAVTRRVLEDLERRNARLPADQAIPLPKEAALSRAIGRRIARLDPWEVDRARWGRRIADRRRQPTQAQRLASRVLERVELDHSPLKVVVGNQAGPIGQPWLTVLIDYYSRMILGFCLGFEPPSYAVVMEALRHAILPKTHLAQKYPRVRGSWPCFGLPEKLVCDRGPDLTSRDLEQAAFQLGIELDFTPPRTPHFKGAVESFFDVLNDQLAASLPGRTFRSWERRGDYNPDDGPLLPYEALLEIIHLHLVDVYAASKHPTMASTRLETWRAGAAEYPPCLPAAPEDLVVLLAKRVERTLSTRGIELAGMFYSSADLMQLRAELAAQNLACDRLQVRYNPWDLGQAWVLNPINKTYILAPAVDPAMVGMTEHQWRVLKRAVRERFDDPEHVASLTAGRNAIRDVVEAAVQKPSRRRRTRAARFLQPPPQAHEAAPDSEERWVDLAGPTRDETKPPNPLNPPNASYPDSRGGDKAPQADPSSCADEGWQELDVDDWDVTT